MESSVAGLASIDLNQIGLFVRVVELGSFTVAAALTGHRFTAAEKLVGLVDPTAGCATSS